MFIKPTNPDIRLRDPVTGLHLAVDGEEKPDNAFWHRRIKDGDCKITRKPKPTRRDKS